MAVDITNGIGLKITDGISVSIPNKLKTIAADSRLAADNVGDLQSKLNAINAAGVGSLSTSMRSTANATKALADNQDKYTNAAAKSVTATNNFTFALGKLTQQAATAAANVAKLQAATLGYNTAARSVVATSNAAVNGTNNLGRATSNTVSATQAATADIGLLEGRMMSANRAAAAFAVKILGLGPILQAAFVVTGIIAVIEVLVQVGEQVYKLSQYYHSVSVEAGNALLAMQEAGKIQIQGQHGVGDTLKNIVASRPNAPDEVITDPKKVIDDSNAWLQYQKAVQAATDAKYRGVDADKAKIASMATEQQQIAAATKNLEKERQHILDVRDAQITVTKHVNTGDTFAPSSVDVKEQQRLIPASTPQSPNEEYDKLTAAANEYKSAIDNNRKAFNLLGPAMDEVRNREPFHAIKDNAKAAAAQMKQFEDQLAAMRKGDSVVTPQATLDFWKSRTNVNPLNKEAVDTKEGNAQQAIDRQAESVQNLTDKLKDQVADIGLYSNALTIKRDLDKDVETQTRAGVVVTKEMTDAWREQITTIVDNARYGQELKAVYQEFNGPLEAFRAGVQASGKLLSDGAITGKQYATSIRGLQQTYLDATDPLNAFNRALEQQKDLTSSRGTTQQQAVNNQVGQLSQQLQNGPQHMDKTSADAMAETRRQEIALTQQAKEAQSAYNAILDSQAGAMQKLVVQQQALIQVRKDGLITDDAYRGQMTKITNEIITQHEIMGDATWEQQAKGALTNYAKDYESFAKSTGDLYKQTFKTIADGAADSIGRAIVYADNLNDALKDVARQALQEIISGMIKIAIQWAINKFLNPDKDNAGANSVKEQAAQTATAIGAIAAITAAQFVAISLLQGPAWDLAEAVSIFSFGAADAAAITGMAAVKAAGSAAKFANGGYVTGPGSATSDSIPAQLSNGEYVWDAQTTKQNYNLIAGIHRGAVRQFAAGGMVGAQVRQSGTASYGGSSMTIEMHDHVGVAVTTQRVDENRVRMIVREMGPGMVAQHAPGVIANEFANPNSAPSKGVRNNITTSRIR